MGQFKKYFAYWAGIDLETQVAASVYDYFSVKPDKVTNYDYSRLLLEFFEDRQDEGQPRWSSRKEGYVRCLREFTSFASKLSSRGEIHIMLRVETISEEYVDCILFRPSDEKEFQIVYEKGLDGNNPNRFCVTDEEKAYFSDFLGEDTTYVEANQKDWSESVSLVVRNAIVHVIPLNEK